MVLEPTGSKVAPGKIWLQRLLMRSSEALDPLETDVEKRGTDAELPWGAQAQDGAERLSGGGAAKPAGPKVWDMMGTEEGVGVGISGLE